MSFDEKLRQSFDEFADQLRDEAKRRLSSLTDELGDAYENERQALAKTAEENARRTLDQEVASRVATEVAAVEARMSEAVSAAETRGGETGRKTGLEEGKQLGREEGRQQGREEGFREGRVDGIEHLKASEIERSQRVIEAIRAIDGSKSLTEVLDSLASSAGNHARRAAIFLLRNGQLKGWRFIGFGSLDEKTDVDLPASDAGVIAEAARTGSAVSADSAAANAAPAFAALPPGREVLAVPVVMSGQIVAVRTRIQVRTIRPAGIITSSCGRRSSSCWHCTRRAVSKRSPPFVPPRLSPNGPTRPLSRPKETRKIRSRRHGGTRAS
jgi:hypothetical protein